MEKEIDNTKEAKALYESNKADWSCNEDTFVKAYNKYINKGLTAEQVKEQLTVEYSKSYKEEQETVKKEENKQEPQKEEPKQEENKTLTLKEAYSLEPSGSYTEEEIPVDATVKQLVKIDKVVRRTYENGAIRDFTITGGKERMRSILWGADAAEYGGGVGGISVEVGTTTNTNKQDTNKQNQNTDKKVVYKGIVPPRSKYSSDAEWKKVADKALAGMAWDGSAFSSKADATLFCKLCEGGEFTGDLDFANMDGEEWKQWCKENGFTVK